MYMNGLDRGINLKCAIVVDGHLGRTEDGLYWSSGIYNYNFFSRYLNIFEKIKVVIRIQDIDSNEDYPNLCSGEGVEFHEITEYRGPKEFIHRFFDIKKEIVEAFDDCDCAILRVPSNIGFLSFKQIKKMKIPFAIEVVIDPWDFAAPGTIKTVLRPLIRVLWTRYLKEACICANGVSYVTKNALQRRYPSYSRLNGEDAFHFESYYSSVNLPDWFFIKEKKFYNLDKMRIVHVANTIVNKVKGHEELILAIKKLKDNGINVEVNFVGDGPLVDKFKEFAKEIDVISQINFIGRITRQEDYRDYIKNNDIMVLPTHAEGLPRALIEAMAVGLPCISTNVNGIPELLDDEFLINVGDVDTLAEKIQNFIENPCLLSCASKKNIKVAWEYNENLLEQRRDYFYGRLKEVCECIE